jgi:hypothetical protein
MRQNAGLLTQHVSSIIMSIAGVLTLYSIYVYATQTPAQPHPPLPTAPHHPSTQHLYNPSPHPYKIPPNQILSDTKKKDHIHVQPTNHNRILPHHEYLNTSLLTTTLHTLHQWTKPHYSYFSRLGHQKAVLTNVLLKIGIIMLETC